MNTITLYTNFQYFTEVEDVAKLFFNVLSTRDENADLTLVANTIDNLFVAKCTFGETVVEKSIDLPSNDHLQAVRLSKRYAKIATYECLKAVTGKSMPWGSLTGIRPTKLACQLQAEGQDYQCDFANLFDVSSEKLALVDQILDQQTPLRKMANKGVDLYVGIPFCVSRCTYCSFTGGEIARLSKYVKPFVDTLCYEIGQTLDFLKEKGIEINNVYFGGGTPTSLEVEDLEKILACINFVPKEYCIEAGRPDTITKEKLDLFAKYGVNRISVNPQTFNQQTLDAIGRKHTVEQIYEVYNLARQYKFLINMDLIAGLPGESYQMFCSSVDQAIALNPDNLTVHTLAIKNGSVLKHQTIDYSHEVKNMVDYAHDSALQNQYLPYYMYRQKYMSENLENVGFCKKGTACVYNVNNMEEIASIVACGANAISKRVFDGENRIERAANPKDVITYVTRIDDFIAKKKQLFS